MVSTNAMVKLNSKEDEETLLQKPKKEHVMNTEQIISSKKVQNRKEEKAEEAWEQSGWAVGGSIMAASRDPMDTGAFRPVFHGKAKSTEGFTEGAS